MSYDDLNDHPFAVHMAAEAYESPAEKAWLAWCARVERLLGHSLDGDQARDGYSLDYASDEFSNGLTPAQYVAEVRERQATTKPAHGSQEWAETYRDDLGESFD